MKSWHVHVKTSVEDRVIVVYAKSRKDAAKVFQQQWGAAFGNNYTIDAIFQSV